MRDDPFDDPWASLRRWTPARIALGRTGDALPTRRVLEFQLAHAEARDAVRAALDADRLAGELADLDPVLVASRAATRDTYLRRPDLGRRLDDASAARLRPGAFDALAVIGDGLSAQAAQEGAPALVRRLRAGRPDWRWAPPVIARHARVTLGDEVAAGLGAALVVVLIGERPGLSAPRSLGAYVTWAPRPGLTRDAERNCVSNIRPAGLPVEEAATRLLALMSAARTLRLTGVGLKEDAALALETRPAPAARDP